MKAKPVRVSRTLSEDSVLGSSLDAGNPSKARRSTAPSVALDFLESQAQVRRGSAAAHRSEPLKKCPTTLSTRREGPDLDDTKSSVRTDAFAVSIMDVEDAPKHLPLSTDDHEDNMPAGNFYTSRGFWRKLEGDRLLWEKGREPSGDARPPAKPQRTFQYRGADGGTRDPQSAHPNVRRRRKVAQPPSFPPPPCPVAKTDGLSRHKKNRSVGALCISFVSR